MIDRRTILTAALAAAAGPARDTGSLAQAAMSRITAYAFSFPRPRRRRHQARRIQPAVRC